MFAATPPLPGPEAPLYVRRAARRRFPGPAVFAAQPGHQAHLRTYIGDLARPYAVALREATFALAEGHSYGEMGAALIRAVVPPDEPADLLVMAFAVPDIRPGRATATYLSEICPGAPLAFAVTDQGPAAAYTGLRLVREYARSGSCRRAVLLVVEQAGRPYEPADDSGWPSVHSGVALVCDATGPARLADLRQHPGVAPDDLERRLAAEVADLAAGWPDGPTLILGPGAARLAGQPGGRVRLAPAGQPTTGGWWELADELTGAADPGAPPRRVVLADYDAGLGYLNLLTADLI